MRKENPYKDLNIEHHYNILQESSLAHRTARGWQEAARWSQYIQRQTALLKKSNLEHRHRSFWQIIRKLTSSNWALEERRLKRRTSEHSKSVLGSHLPTPYLISLQFFFQSMHLGISPHYLWFFWFLRARLCPPIPKFFQISWSRQYSFFNLETSISSWRPSWIF